MQTNWEVIQPNTQLHKGSIHWYIWVTKNVLSYESCSPFCRLLSSIPVDCLLLLNASHALFLQICRVQWTKSWISSRVAQTKLLVKKSWQILTVCIKDDSHWSLLLLASSSAIYQDRVEEKTKVKNLEGEVLSNCPSCWPDAVTSDSRPTNKCFGDWRRPDFFV